MPGCRLCTRQFHEMMPNCFPTLRQFTKAHSHRKRWELLPGLGLAKRSGFCQSDGRGAAFHHGFVGLLRKQCFSLQSDSMMSPLPTIHDLRCILSNIQSARHTLECPRLSPMPHLLSHISFHFLLPSLCSSQPGLRHSNPSQGLFACCSLTLLSVWVPLPATSCETLLNGTPSDGLPFQIGPRPWPPSVLASWSLPYNTSFFFLGFQ